MKRDKVLFLALFSFFSIATNLFAQTVNDWETPNVNGINKERPYAYNFLTDKKRETSIFCRSMGGSFEIRLISKDGELIGNCSESNTGNWNIWKPFNFKVKKVKGVHNVFILFKGSASNLFNLDFWWF